MKQALLLSGEENKTGAGGGAEESVYLTEMREREAADAPCSPLPLLFPTSTVVEDVEGEDESGEGGRVLSRVYLLDREDGEGTMIVKQTSDRSSLREAFVLRELMFASPRDQSGVPLPFPIVFGDKQAAGWSACALQNFEGRTLLQAIEEDPELFKEDGMAFDVIDKLLVGLGQLQAAGVTHRRLTGENVMLVAGDVPAIVNFDMAVARGMPFEAPPLPPSLQQMYAGVDGEDLPQESDVFALALTLEQTMPPMRTTFAPVLEVMKKKWRPERITHIQSLRLLLGSFIENRTDLVEFRGDYEQQARQFPGNGVPPNNLGSVYFDSQMLKDALALFLAAVPLTLPFKSGAKSNIAAVRKMMCHWDHYEEDARHVIDTINEGGEEVHSIRNLYALALNLSMHQHVAISSAGAHHSYKRGLKEWRLLRPSLSLPSSRPHMVLAYVSSDLLTGHAVAGSMRRVMELHDHRRFQVLLVVLLVLVVLVVVVVLVVLLVLLVLLVWVYGVKVDQAAAALADPRRAGLGPAQFVDASRAEQSELAQWINDAGPLLCNWNQHFKLDPEFFAVWVRILMQVPNSTLVMLKYPEESEPHLRYAARKQQLGLTGERLIFLPKASLTEHLMRTSFCDLFLDNREYNSGTTCTDSLWAGVPTISMPRMKHAAVGGNAQLLQARNLEEYESMSVLLLRKVRWWERVHEAIVSSRNVSVLWDPSVWVRDVERALMVAWEWHVAAVEEDPEPSSSEDAPPSLDSAPLVPQPPSYRTDKSIRRSELRLEQVVRVAAQEHGRGPWKCQRHYGHVVVANVGGEEQAGSARKQVKAQVSPRDAAGQASHSPALSRREEASKGQGKGGKQTTTRGAEMKAEEVERATAWMPFS
ncbi:hypothetical protein GUITHDRAFT_141110 [Guillardia theta CCMP2712]|uniref:O-GlcNAc transferase C-terminal domain-containing protein n=1 Tax=Guillardia theta (strain CCMP2712) TaxID=905079 RepID=L1J2F7_GUITC|nr:hypothetical protein GUITHDRAFT_141110 [Guillardia theta CCMP2712]EKX42713.1 hypothetical protein GUITHDRAFT_141110 [Guillardia theta CCMP2712]|eukprot:XP_005829693.1 hypothetical protein GUITHDRAFT_141110 [Guillardia theta CCMP2712]